ncbi:NYN domain-containing protein [Dysgonomonas sp. GY75]|uniref:NYN domain-containing protein n=1 Tax=Dysgonomonas sp. GY75 TaxID=2780419 RepID=UPI00188320A3|nr:NYN domain-containing protein [Dysgonomonas sp. GY75]MBF0647246.1 NYN domain-containing protein [Dysgonomonas sp. GY75]
MAKKETKEKKHISLAVLVDGDNATASRLTDVIKFVSGYGEPIVKRIYADWSKTGTSQWKEPAKELAFRLIEATSYVKGKNTTDIALVMDAMDLLHSGIVNGFCIVASDGDYTLLAQRIREEGLLILGYGESKTPLSFAGSCRKFQYSDKEPPKAETPDCLLKKEAEIFDRAFNIFGKEEVALSLLGPELKKILPKYKPRRYGCKTLGAIYEKLDKYELIRTGQKGIYNIVRLKKPQESQ